MTTDRKKISDLGSYMTLGGDKHTIKVITICRGKDKAGWKSFVNADCKKTDNFWMPDKSELQKDFECPNLPFAALADKSGLIVWSGHPDDRNLKEDFEELIKDHMIFETQDWHDDPDQPTKDPDEIDMYKERDEDTKEVKSTYDKLMKEHHDKIHFF